jgi:hypothetical protein
MSEESDLLLPSFDGYMISIRLFAMPSPNPTPTHEYAGLVKYIKTSLESFAMLTENCVSVSAR